MRNLLITTLVALGFSFTANAGELVFSNGNNGASGTAGGISIFDEDTGADNNPWGFQGEYYKSMSDAVQIGGRLGFADADVDGAGLGYLLGVFGRFNLGEEMNTSMFALGGISIADNGADAGDTSTIAAHIGFGKRFALSENITWQPNVEVVLNVAGDFDEGTAIYVNILSFGGMANIF